MRKEPKSKVLGVVEVKLDLSDPQIVKALQGPRGLKGEAVKGDPGKKGDKSTEPGLQGPAPTEEQIAKAVADYLRGKDLKGPKGDSIRGEKANDPDRQYLKLLIQEVLADKLGG